MWIADLELFLVPDAGDAAPRPLRWLVVRLATDNGLEGWGETRVPWREGELAARREALSGLLCGRNLFDIEELLRLEGLRDRSLRCAVETACWDLVGKLAGLPLFQLFGGAYRQQVPLAVRLEGDSPDDLARLARQRAEMGFHAQIVTSSGEIDEDVRRVTAVREGVGETIALRLDGARRYDMESARDLCAALEFEGLQFFLDPLAGGDLFAMASLSRQTSVPLAAGRSIGGPADVLAAVRCGAALHLVVDVTRLGGLTAARKAAAIVEAAGLSASLAGGPSLGIATAVMAHLAASTPVLAGCHECPHHGLEDDVLDEPVPVVEGMLRVSHGPGLGVEVNRARLDRLQIA